MIASPSHNDVYASPNTSCHLFGVTTPFPSGLTSSMYGPLDTLFLGAEKSEAADDIEAPSKIPKQDQSELDEYSATNYKPSLYPEDNKMLILAELFSSASNCFKILTSTQILDKGDPLKNALRVNLTEQLTHLNKFEELIKTM